MRRTTDILRAMMQSFKDGGKVLVCLLLLVFAVLVACEREPELHLHRGGSVNIKFPTINLELDTYWDYQFEYDVDYDWQTEWHYGWDAIDAEVFGHIGYAEPTSFQLRRYFTGDNPSAPHTQVQAHVIEGHSFQGEFDWGYWDLLIWNDIHTIDGVQSLNFDESSTLEYVTAYTNQTMVPTRYNAPRYTRSFYEPEGLFSVYSQDIEVSEDLKGFEYDPVRNLYVKRLDMVLKPVTYIYLTQVILHNNHNKITGVDGSANLSGMARTMNLNTQVAGPDAITVHYNVRYKEDCEMDGEPVDIIGGRLMTFGMCNIDPNRVARGETVNDKTLHYMDVTMLFNNGIDSTFVFDVTDQVRQKYKGGVLTIELDMDTVPVPTRSGGSAFDAVVKGYEDGGTHEFEM